MSRKIWLSSGHGGSDENTYFIYTLNCPEKPEIVKYVGYTKNPKRRLNKHLNSYKKGTNKIKCWIKSLHNKNLKPIMNIIDKCKSIEEIKKLEIQYIALYKSLGANLKNGTIGGEGVNGYNHLEETKLKISKNHSKHNLGKRKYNIIDEDVKKLFLEGKNDREIANILNCPSISAIKESRKRQNLYCFKVTKYNSNTNFNINLTPEILKKYYIDENKTKKEISLLIGATERNIKKRLKDWNIYKSEEQKRIIYKNNIEKRKIYI